MPNAALRTVGGMERTRALALAGGVGLACLTGTLAFAANTGLLGFGGPDHRVGSLTSTEVVELVGETATPTAAPSSVVRYVDVYVTTPAVPTSAETTGAAPSASGSTEPATADGQDVTVALADEGRGGGRRLAVRRRGPRRGRGPRSP